MTMTNAQTLAVEQLLQRGLEDLWYPLCPSHFLKDTPLSLRRLGHKLALWRDHAGQLHALEDHRALAAPGDPRQLID
jgi:phenylpropionate dioxygenase-like ring-hydroxylating dioxygenase large terminal subunit